MSQQTTEVRQSALMAHLIDALEAGQDIGHYGRLVFTMIGRYFLLEEEIVRLLTKNPGVSELEAKALYLEVKAHDYNPPRRNTILDWQRRQDFPICPNPEDPNGCDVYQELRFPQDVYDRIQDFYEDLVKEEEQNGNGEEAGREDRSHSGSEESRKSRKTA